MQYTQGSSVNFFKANAQFFFFALLLTLVMFMPVRAEDPGVCNTLNNFQTLLKGASVVVVTLAIMWAGYKFLFARAEISECGKIIAAGVMIGSASAIAGMLLGTEKCDDSALKSSVARVPFSCSAPLVAKASPDTILQLAVLKLKNEA